MNDSALTPVAGMPPSGDFSALRAAYGNQTSQRTNIGAVNSPGGTASADEAMETAKKFEALLIHNMLKAMRSTTFAEEGGQDQSMYYDMLDEKLAGIVTENGGMGLAENLARQLEPRIAAAGSASGSSRGLTTDAIPVTTTGSVPGLDQSELRHLRSIVAPVTTRDTAPGTAIASSDTHDDTTAATLDRLRLSRSLWSDIGQPGTRSLRDVQKNFVDELMPMARQVAARLGTTPASVLAVAAHESDWGRQVIGNQAGDSSHNLFGIKAFDEQRPGMWHATTEYVNGKAERLQERFRSYVDKNASMNDFASFLQQNPRYSTALQHAGTPDRFIKELHSAGYATDPDYAGKVMGVMRQIEALAPATQGRSAS